MTTTPALPSVADVVAPFVEAFDHLLRLQELDDVPTGCFYEDGPAFAAIGRLVYLVEEIAILASAAVRSRVSDSDKHLADRMTDIVRTIGYTGRRELVTDYHNARIGRLIADQYATH